MYLTAPVVKLAAGKTFDYETIQYYNVTFTVSDTKATGGPFVLNVHILNENEPCYFDKTLYSLTAYEGSVSIYRFLNVLCISVLRKFEDIKGVMRRGNTKKDKQCNGQKKKKTKG